MHHGTPFHRASAYRERRWLRKQMTKRKAWCDSNRSNKETKSYSLALSGQTSVVRGDRLGCWAAFCTGFRCRSTSHACEADRSTARMKERSKPWNKGRDVKRVTQKRQSRHICGRKTEVNRSQYRCLLSGLCLLTSSAQQHKQAPAKQAQQPVPAPGPLDFCGC